MPGHLTASTKWTDGTTKLEFTIQAGQMAIHQDGRQIAVTSVAGSLGKNLKQFKTVKNVKWGEGIYGRFGGASLDGRVSPQN